MPPGAENPSAAYLAGQQHGQTLAVKHATPAKKGASPKKPAAKTAPVNDPVAQARAAAQADTQAAIDLYRAQQDMTNRQAQDRAGQVTLASQAAAKYLSGIGDQTAGSYNNAAQILAGLAQGYSGDLKQTATDAASQVQQQLAGLNAPAGGLKTSTGETAQPASLANVLYGLGGQIPANLLVTSGQALAGAQRQLPQATLGYGQQQAAGTLAAGQDEAAKLTPQILAAQAGQPKLARDYLAQIQSALLGEKKYAASRSDAAFNQRLAAAKYTAGVDQFNVRSGQTQQRIGQTQQQINISSQRLANQAYQSDRSYKLSLDSLGIRQKAQQLKALADEAKLKNGGFTAAKIQEYKGTAATIADQAWSGVSPSQPDGYKNPETDRMNVGNAMASMRQHGVPVSIAQAALAQAGYKIPAAWRLKEVAATASPFEVVNSASSFLGIPYSWGGGTPKGPTKGFAQGAGTVGYDCSSFVQAVMAKAGVQLPRTTQAQVKAGRPVSLAELQPGDLIFTRPGKNGPNHVGLYIGNGQVQESPHTGAVNRVVSLPSYLSNGFVAARRCLGG